MRHRCGTSSGDRQVGSSLLMSYVAWTFTEVSNALRFDLKLDRFVPSRVLRPMRRLLVPVVRAGLRHRNWWVQTEFLEVAADWDLRRLAGLVLAACSDDDAEVRRHAFCLASRWDVPGINEALVDACEDEYAHNRRIALRIVVERGMPQADVLVIRLLHDPENYVRVDALYLAKEHLGRDALPHIMPLLADPDPWVSETAASLTAYLQGLCAEPTARDSSDALAAREERAGPPPERGVP